jgi:hypothetical protein
MYCLNFSGHVRGYDVLKRLISLSDSTQHLPLNLELVVEKLHEVLGTYHPNHVVKLMTQVNNLI